jgi:hypothetical protein
MLRCLESCSAPFGTGHPGSDGPPIVSSRTSHALWLWLQHTDLARSWTSLPLKVDETTSAFFKASTRPMLGDGKTLMFWSDSYLDGHYITEIAPQLVAAVPCRCLRRRTVATMLVHHDWVRDTIGALTIPVLVQFLQLRQRLDEVVLQHDPRPDRLVWKWSASGTFSTSSAYKAVSGASGHSSRQGSP